MSGLMMRSFTWNRFPIKFVIDSLLISPGERSCLNTDMHKFELLQKEESTAQSADSSKAYRIPSRAFNWIHSFWSLASSCTIKITQLPQSLICVMTCQNMTDKWTGTKPHSNRNWNINRLARAGSHKYSYWKTLQNVTLCAKTSNTLVS